MVHEYLRVWHIFHVGIQAIHCLPSFFTEKFIVSHPMNGINSLHCLQYCFGWLEAIGWSIAKNQGDSVENQNALQPSTKHLEIKFRFNYLVHLFSTGVT